MKREPSFDQVAILPSFGSTDPSLGELVKHDDQRGGAAQQRQFAIHQRRFSLASILICV